jgi:lambda family phage portal protein
VPETLRQRIGRLIAGKPAPAPAAAPQRRAYAAARPSRNSSGFGGTTTSADAELATSLARLRNGSRQMVRDAAYARRARTVVVNNVIGSGVGLQANVRATRGDLRGNVNDAIERAWLEWMAADSCHTGGVLHFHDLERAAMGQVFEAGECFVRMHYRAFGQSRVPLALELVEAERVPDNLVEPGAASATGEVRMGIEVDVFGRPQFVWIRERHPGDVRGRISGTERYERVPASDVFHLRIVTRWPQTRGEPWMHAVVRKLDDMNELTSAELQAVRASAYYFGTITTPEGPAPDATGVANDTDAESKPVMDIEPLTITQMAEGEQFQFHAPNRPNANLDAFLRHMVREFAAGSELSYESLSRDYSQSNYSSSRLALLDDRDNWKALQQWWIRSFREPLHRVWLRQAVLARAIPQITPEAYASDMERYGSVRFKPRGWSWIDPTKEVEAYKEAIRGGLTTLTDVIAQTADGRDIEDVVETRKRELELLAEHDLEVDTTFEAPAAAAAPAAPAATRPGAPSAADDNDDDVEGSNNTSSGRVVPLAKR